MLDLTAYKKYYEIKMPEGDILQINRPSQAMLSRLIKLQSIKDSDIDNALDEMWSILLDILNNNINGKVYDAEYINKHFDISIVSVVITDYLESVLDELAE